MHKLFNSKNLATQVEQNIKVNPDATIKISLHEIEDTFKGNVDIIRPLIEEIKTVGFPPIILIVQKVQGEKTTYRPVPEQAFLIQAAKMAYVNQKLNILIPCVEVDSKLGKVFTVYAEVRNQINKESLKFRVKLQEFSKIIGSLEIEQ